MNRTTTRRNTNGGEQHNWQPWHEISLAVSSTVDNNGNKECWRWAAQLTTMARKKFGGEQHSWLQWQERWLAVSFTIDSNGKTEGGRWAAQLTEMATKTPDGYQSSNLKGFIPQFEPRKKRLNKRLVYFSILPRGCLDYYPVKYGSLSCSHIFLNASLLCTTKVNNGMKFN